MKKAAIAGSFDPITKGHLWMIEKAAEIFDEVHILIAKNPNKKSMFTTAERESAIVDSLPSNVFRRTRLSVMDDDAFTVNYAADLGCTHIVRGIRNTTDFEFEHQINLINREISPSVETVYLMPPRELIEVSSSMVKGLMGLKGWEKIASKYVTPHVLRMLIEKTQNV